MNLAYAVWLTVSGGIALLVGWLAWQRRPASGASALVVLMLSLAVWSFSYAAHWLSLTEEARAFWLNMTYFGAVAAPVAFLALAALFIGRGDRLILRDYVLLSIIPALSLIILWTDPWHGLFYGRDRSNNTNMVFEGGPWFYVLVAYSYVLILIGAVLLFRTHMRSPFFYRRQTRVMLIGGLLPWAVNFLMLVGWNPFAGLDLTPIAFTGTGLLFAYGLFGYRLMDLAPVARDVLVENMREGVLAVDLEGRLVDINPRAMELADPGVEMPFGKPLAAVFSRWGDLIKQYDVTEGHFSIKLPHPPYWRLNVHVLPLKDRQGRTMGRLITWDDVTAQRQTEEEMRLFRYAVDQNPSGVLITDPEGRIEYVNRQFTNMTGYTLEEARGKTPRILKSGETPETIYSELWSTIKRGETWQAEMINRKKNGELYWANQLIAPVTNANGVLTHFVAMQQDITMRKHNESELMVTNTRMKMQLSVIEQLHQQLREESIRDSLTRLFNRRFMEETLERELSRAERDSVPISAVMMDVDLFKSINDAYGHQAGDNVLQTLGALLLENTRTGDIACRYGGDEMVVLLPGAPLEIALRRAEEWREAFSLLVFSFGETRVQNSLSLGVASFPAHAKNPNELLLAADKALYRAKIRRNSVFAYDPASMARSDKRSSHIR